MISIIGGGHGQSYVVSSIKDLELVSFVHPFDEGGDTGKIKREYNVQAVGDARRNFLFPYFEKIDEETGHKIGNLLITNYIMTYGPNEGLLKLSNDLGIKRKILFSTTDLSRICVITKSRVYIGERNFKDIREKVERVCLYPEAKLDRIAKMYLINSKAIMTAPGSLYSSLVPHLLIKGFVDTIKQKFKILIVNGMRDNESISIKSISDYVKVFKSYGFSPDVVIAPEGGWLSKDYNSVLVKSKNGIYDKKSLRKAILKILDSNCCEISYHPRTCKLCE